MLIFSSLAKATFPNRVGVRRLLLGNVTINSRNLPRDLLWITGAWTGMPHPHPTPTSLTLHFDFLAKLL